MMAMGLLPPDAFWMQTILLSKVPFLFGEIHFHRLPGMPACNGAHKLQCICVANKCKTTCGMMNRTFLLEAVRLHELLCKDLRNIFHNCENLGLWLTPCDGVNGRKQVPTKNKLLGRSTTLIERERIHKVKQSRLSRTNINTFYTSALT